MADTPHSPHYHLKCGIAYMLAASFFFTLITALSQFATRQVSVPTVVFFQNFIAWFTVLPWFFKHGKSFLYITKWKLLLIRCVGVFAFMFIFLAAETISLVDATLLNNASPFIIPFVVWGWLKVPINHKLWIGITCGFIGILFILKPGVEIVNYGALFAIGSAMINAVVMVSLRLLSFTERNHTVIFYYCMIASLVMLPLMLYTWVPPSVFTWIILLGVGVASALGQWAFVMAFHHAKPTQLSPFVYAGVVYAAIFDWILYSKIPGTLTIIGILLVCIGGIWSIRYSATTSPKSIDPKDY